MSLPKITQVAGTAVVVPGDDIDTDQIIPARFMRCVTFDGLGVHAFHDARFDAAGRSKGYPLDRLEHKGATILVSGRNFGCGSSREHAPQALHKFGIRAIVAGSFAEIFFGNCTTLGIPCVVLEKKELDRLSRAVEKTPSLAVVVDVAAGVVRYGGQAAPFTMRENARRALLDGEWDAIGLLLEGQAHTAQLEARLPRFVRGGQPWPPGRPADAPAVPPALAGAWITGLNPALPAQGELY